MAGGAISDPLKEQWLGAAYITIDELGFTTIVASATTECWRLIMAAEIVLGGDPKVVCAADPFLRYKIERLNRTYNLIIIRVI